MIEKEALNFADNLILNFIISIIIFYFLNFILSEFKISFEDMKDFKIYTISMLLAYLFRGSSRCHFNSSNIIVLK